MLFYNFFSCYIFLQIICQVESLLCSKCFGATEKECAKNETFVYCDTLINEQCMNVSFSGYNNGKFESVFHRNCLVVTHHYNGCDHACFLAEVLHTKNHCKAECCNKDMCNTRDENIKRLVELGLVTNNPPTSNSRRNNIQLMLLIFTCLLRVLVT